MLVFTSIGFYAIIHTKSKEVASMRCMLLALAVAAIDKCRRFGQFLNQEDCAPRVGMDQSHRNTL